MILEELAKLVKVNETDDDKVSDIAESIKAGTFTAPAILVWEDMNQAVTGSHRIAAAQLLINEDEESWWNYDIETVDVSDVMNDTDSPEYDNLRSMFEGTQFEDDARQNDEW